MTRRSTPNSNDKPPPALLTRSREEAARLIQEQIKEGESIEARLSTNQLSNDQAKDVIVKWKTIATEMLRRLFTTEEYSTRFSTSANHIIFANFGLYASRSTQRSRPPTDQRQVLKEYLDDLGTLLQSLPFIDAPAPFIQTQKPGDVLMSPAHQKMQNPIEENAWRLLGLMVERPSVQYFDSAELQEWSGIEHDHDVNDAVEFLEEQGAVKVGWAESADGTKSAMVELKGKGKTMCRERTSTQVVPDNGKTLIIHGHDESNRLRLKNFLATKLGLPEPVIMAEQTTPGATLPEKFERIAQDVQFAVALMTPDDEGKATAAADLKPRCRQNVIVEIGWFWGRLGRDHILLLVKDQVEMPSDLQGLEYFTFSNTVAEVSENIRDFYKAHGVQTK